jgi:hypothetical protein
MTTWLILGTLYVLVVAAFRASGASNVASAALQAWGRETARADRPSVL